MRIRDWEIRLERRACTRRGHLWVAEVNGVGRPISADLVCRRWGCSARRQQGELPKVFWVKE